MISHSQLNQCQQLFGIKFTPSDADFKGTCYGFSGMAIKEVTESTSLNEYKKAVLKKEKLYSTIKHDFDKQLQLKNPTVPMDKKQYELILKQEQMKEEAKLPIRDLAFNVLPAFLQGMSLTHNPRLHGSFFSKGRILNQNLNLTFPLTLPKSLVSQVEVFHIRKEKLVNLESLKDSYVLVEGVELFYIDREGRSNEIKMEKNENQELCQILTDHADDLKGIDQDLLSEHFTVEQMEELNTWMVHKRCRPLFGEIPDIVQVISFSGGYTTQDLVIVFSELAEKLELAQLKMPVHFIESSISHAELTTWQYDWLFVDANQLPPKEFKNNQDMASMVLRGVTKNNYATFGTFVFTHVSQADVVKNCIEQCMAESKWQAIHKITLEKVNNNRDSHNTSWLHIVAKTNDVDLLNELVKIPGINYNMATSEGNTPLIVAAARGFDHIIRVLIDMKSDVNTADNNAGTPLHHAAQNGFDTTVQLLLEQKSDVHAITTKGSTPLYLASQSGFDTIVQMLLDRKSDINAATNNGVTSLHHATQKGLHTTVRLLLESKADMNATDKEGITSLFRAAQMGSASLVRLFLDMKGNANIATKTGLTPLYLAAQKGFDQVVELLLNSPKLMAQQPITASITILMNEAKKQQRLPELTALIKEKKIMGDELLGFTPLKGAVCFRHRSTVALLLHKTDPNEEKNISALELARAVGDQPIIAMLTPYFIAYEAKDYPEIYTGLIKKIRESKSDQDGVNHFYKKYGDILIFCSNLNKALQKFEPGNSSRKKGLMVKVQNAIKVAYQDCITEEDLKNTFKKLFNSIHEVIVTAEKGRFNTFVSSFFTKEPFVESLRNAFMADTAPLETKKSPTHLVKREQ